MFKRLSRFLADYRGVGITSDDIAHWNDKGFLVLEGFFSANEIDTFLRDNQKLWENRKEEAGNITIDVLEGELKNQRIYMRDAPDSLIGHAHKVNDLFLDVESCRSLNLNKRLSKILTTLLDGKPLVINSLNFIKGSQQPLHFDTYFMPPPVPHKMAVSSICLEDQTMDSGPLIYYPGSQKIEPWVFEHGGISVGDGNLDEATAYAVEQIDRLDLQPETFVGKKGDVFIWHSQLYHGGTPIAMADRTRRTLVTHYWRSQDVAPENVAYYSEGGDFMRREHPKLEA